MQRLTCPTCGEVTELDEEELAVCDSVGLLLCSACESPLRDEAELVQHALAGDRELLDSACRPRPFSVELVEDLTEAVRILADQVRCLRLAIDEIEAELGWTIRQRVIEPVRTPVNDARPVAMAAPPAPALVDEAPAGQAKAGPAVQQGLWH